MDPMGIDMIILENAICSDTPTWWDMFPAHLNLMVIPHMFVSYNLVEGQASTLFPHSPAPLFGPHVNLILNCGAVTAIVWTAPGNHWSIRQDRSKCTICGLNLVYAPQLMLNCGADGPRQPGCLRGWAGCTTAVRCSLSCPAAGLVRTCPWWRVSGCGQELFGLAASSPPQ